MLGYLSQKVQEFLYIYLKKDNILIGDSGSYFLGFTLVSLPLLILIRNVSESILPYFNQNIFFDYYKFIISIIGYV